MKVNKFRSDCTFRRHVRVPCGYNVPASLLDQLPKKHVNNNQEDFLTKVIKCCVAASLSGASQAIFDQQYVETNIYI